MSTPQPDETPPLPTHPSDLRLWWSRSERAVYRTYTDTGTVFKAVEMTAQWKLPGDVVPLVSTDGGTATPVDPAAMTDDQLALLHRYATEGHATRLGDPPLTFADMHAEIVRLRALASRTPGEPRERREAWIGKAGPSWLSAPTGMCPTCSSGQPHLHPSSDLCPDPWHQPVPTTANEWRSEMARWAGLIEQIADGAAGDDALRRVVSGMRDQAVAAPPLRGDSPQQDVTACCDELNPDTGYRCRRTPIHDAGKSIRKHVQINKLGQVDWWVTPARPTAAQPSAHDHFCDGTCKNARRGSGYQCPSPPTGVTPDERTTP